MRLKLPLIAALIFAPLLAGCGVNGDFGEISPSLTSDDMHAWVGRDSAKGGAISSFEMTDEERRLRDFAYPLLAPPYLRNKVTSVAYEYGMDPAVQKQLADPATYYEHMMSNSARSPTSRYATLTDDIRNDSVRLPRFFEMATRVVDLDMKRKKSLAFVRGLSEAERTNTLNRIAENDRVIARVRMSLDLRVNNYRYALERLAISSPSQEAVTVEQSLTRLSAEVAHYRTHTAPLYQRGPSLAFQR